MATDPDHGHSLWFVPDGPSKIVLDSIIHTLSRRLSAPLFTPHLTLIPDVIGTAEEVLRHTGKIASQIPKFKISFNKIDFVTGSLYQCLYVYCDPTPELNSAVQIARQEFARLDDPPHKPHISVLYKQETPDEVKQQLIAEFTPRITGLSFIANHIEVWTNGLPIENWDRVGKYPCSFQLVPRAGLEPA